MPATKATDDMGELKDLAPLSPRINSATDELNRALETIQNKLNDLALGVEAWVVDTPLSKSRPKQGDDDDYRSFDAEELGYGRHDDSWALLVRTMRYPEETDSLDNYQAGSEPPVASETARRPLLRSARHLRVRSVDLIPDLIDAVRTEAEAVIDAVGRAKQIAASLK